MIAVMGRVAEIAGDASLVLLCRAMMLFRDLGDTGRLYQIESDRSNPISMEIGEKTMGHRDAWI